MSYSEINEAIALTGTELDSTTIAALRNAADDEICDVLERESMNLPSTVPRAIKRASVMLTCRNIIVRQKHDGTAPNVVRAGNYYESTSVDDSIKYFNTQGYGFIYSYINGTAEPLITLTSDIETTTYEPYDEE